MEGRGLDPSGNCWAVLEPMEDGERVIGPNFPIPNGRFRQRRECPHPRTGDARSLQKEGANANRTRHGLIGAYRSSRGLGIPLVNEMRASNPLFQRPTSVFLYGPSEALLDWVALAFASAAEGGYHWTYARTPGHSPDPQGPIAKGAIPADHLRVRDPQELALNHAAANAAITAAFRSEEPLSELTKVVDFLRLPSVTQAFLTSQSPTAEPVVLVVSNAHQLVPLFTVDTVRPVLRTIMARGFAVIATFPGAPTPGRMEFDNVWHLEERDPRSWRKARIQVEQAGLFPPIPPASEPLLDDLPFVASLLSRALDHPV